MAIEGFQHFPFTAGFHKVWGGSHCCQRRIAHRIDPMMQPIVRKYMINFWALLGFKRFINRIATPNFGNENARIPGMKAIVFHLMAFDSCCGAR